MSEEALADVIVAAGFGQLAILAAAALVPFRLNWRDELRPLPRLHRQMYWVYGGYTAMAILSLGLLSICCAAELAAGSALARFVCGYTALFWGLRLLLQAVFDVRDHLTTWWLKTGYGLLTALFASFTLVYAWAALAGR